MECVTALLWRASEWLRAARWLSGLGGGKDVFWSLSLKFQQYWVFFSSCHSIMNLSLKELLQKHNWLRYLSNQAPSINQSGLFFNYIPLKQMFYIPTVPSFSSTCTANTVKLKKCCSCLVWDVTPDCQSTTLAHTESSRLSILWNYLVFL